MSGRTDTHLVVVSNHEDGRRHSYAGSLKACKAEAERVLKLWGKKADYKITKRD